VSASIAFLDESGDTGRYQYGGSALFVVALAVFTDRVEAERCDERISRLRQELRKSARFEWHFRDNGHPERLAFLAAVRTFAFNTYAVILTKGPRQQETGTALYLEACTRVCALAGRELDRSTLVLDESTQNRRAQRQFAAQVRSRVNIEQSREALLSVRLLDSARTPLLQLADYVTGVTSWQEQGKPGAEGYHRLLQAREADIWRGLA